MADLLAIPIVILCAFLNPWSFAVFLIAMLASIKFRWR